MTAPDCRATCMRYRLDKREFSQLQLWSGSGGHLNLEILRGPLPRLFEVVNRAAQATPSIEQWLLLAHSGLSEQSQSSLASTCRSRYRYQERNCHLRAHAHCQKIWQWSRA